MVSKFLKPNKIQISLGFYTMSVIVLLKDGHKYEPEYRWIYLTFLHIHCAIKKKKFGHKRFVQNGRFTRTAILG